MMLEAGCLRLDARGWSLGGMNGDEGCKKEDNSPDQGIGGIRLVVLEFCVVVRKECSTFVPASPG